MLSTASFCVQACRIVDRYVGLAKAGVDTGSGCRADVVPRLSYASVEDAFLELVHSSPVRNAAQSFTRMVNEKLEGLKVRGTQRIPRVALLCPIRGNLLTTFAQSPYMFYGVSWRGVCDICFSF
jgi:hypothetical protein